MNKIAAKQSCLYLLCIFFFSCNGQKNKADGVNLSVSPLINQKDPINIRIIKSLSAFLESKNQSLIENSYWLASDFEKYGYPYYDLYRIEDSKYGENFYKPTLMEIIPTNESDKRIIKIAFIGHYPITKENQLKSIYNLIANIEKEKILFSKYLDYASQHWTTVKAGSVNYKISPRRISSKAQMDQQHREIEKISSFFNTENIPITYYSCSDVKEVFEIRGFDYNTLMYADTTGGLADFGGIVYSGNNSELYTHEIVHVYTQHLFPTIDKFIDEGIATYIGGSSGYDYIWHREQFKSFLLKNPEYKFEHHTDPYERIFFENETSIPYLTAALICERTLTIYGKEKLITLLQSDLDLWTRLSKVGLTKQNIGPELRNTINQPVILPF